MEPGSQQSHCAVVSDSRNRKSHVGDKSTYSNHKVICIFPTANPTGIFVINLRIVITLCWWLYYDKMKYF
jgi:hypothetical protein